VVSGSVRLLFTRLPWYFLPSNSKNWTTIHYAAEHFIIGFWSLFCRHCELQFRHTGNTSLHGKGSWSGACQKTSRGTMLLNNMNKSSSGPSSIDPMSCKKGTTSGVSLKIFSSSSYSKLKDEKTPVHYMEGRPAVGSIAPMSRSALRRLLLWLVCLKERTVMQWGVQLNDSFEE